MCELQSKQMTARGNFIKAKIYNFDQKKEQGQGMPLNKDKHTQMSAHGKPHQAPMPSRTTNNRGGVQIHVPNSGDHAPVHAPSVKIETQSKKIECLKKSMVLQSCIPKGIDIEFKRDAIILKGNDYQKLKTAKDKTNKCLNEKLKHKDSKLTDIQFQILQKDYVVSFIDNELDIKSLNATWEVVQVFDQPMLIVYCFDDKEAKNLIKKIPACIVKEKISMNESKTEWCRELLQKESSKLFTSRTSEGELIICTTIDVHEKYFKLHRKKNQDLSNPKTENHPTTEAAVEAGLPLNESIDQIVSGNQPRAASGERNHVTSQSSGSNAEWMEDEAEEEPSTGKAASTKKTKKQSREESVSLSVKDHEVKYLGIYYSEKLKSIEKNNDCTIELIDHRIVIKGGQKGVQKEIDSLLQSIEVQNQQAFCGKSKLSFDEKQKLINAGKDKMCLVSVNRPQLPALIFGYVASSDKHKMHILSLEGPAYLADVDVILCPVNDKMKPVGKDSECIRRVWDHTTACDAFIDKPSKHMKEEILFPTYKSGNLSCRSVLLVVQDRVKNEEKLAGEIIGHMKSCGYQSLGILINSTSNSKQQAFSSSLIFAIWKISSTLKHPIVLNCFGNNQDLLKNEEYIRTMKISEVLAHFSMEQFRGKERKSSEISVMVEQGSILEFDSKVDVVVNSTSASLDLNNGIVSQKLVEKAGKSVQDDCDKYYKPGIDIGGIAVTNAGKMKCRKIFHIALHTFWVSIGNLSIQILKNLVIRCLKETEKQHLSSIAFPALGTGTLGYPPCLVAKAMFDAVDDFGKKQNPSSVKRVHFVLFDQEGYEIFKNIQDWRNNRKKENVLFEIPPQHSLHVEKDLDTRVIVSDEDFYTSLSFKELKIELSAKEDKELNIKWDIENGCFTTTVKINQSDEGIEECFKSIVKLMQDRRFHMADIFVPSNILAVSLERLMSILTHVLQVHTDKIYQLNQKKAKKAVQNINYVRVVRVFLSSDDYVGFVKECEKENKKQLKNGCEPLWYISNKVSFPFDVGVVGTKSSIKEVMKKVQQEISAIEATASFTIIVKKSEMDKAMKKLEKLEEAGLKVKHDLNQISCEGSISQIKTAKQELKVFEESDIDFDMSEGDYEALINISNDEDWRGYVLAHKYKNGKAIFTLEHSCDVTAVAKCIHSKLYTLKQLATTEVLPNTALEVSQFMDLQSQVEDIGPGVYCFLSKDRKIIIIKAGSYEQVQQAKYMVEVNLGLVQQSGGRKNRRFAAPDEIGTGPAASHTVSEPVIRDGMTFKTKEGIDVFVYSAGIGNLKVDSLVNAANKDLMHGGGIAYHISNAAGYHLDKECDDFVRSHGSLDVGSCCSTTAGNLPYKSVIHAVGPMWHSYSHKNKQHCLDDLKQTVISALKEADQYGFKSIAIPSISSGIFGVPKDVCAQQYYNAVAEYSKKSGGKSTIREVHFIDKDRGMCSLIQKTFEREFGLAGQKM